MKILIFLGMATALAVATQVRGAQVFTPPSTGELAGMTLSLAERSTARWSTNTLYVRDGTREPPVALQTDKDIAELDIADIAGKSSDFAAMDIMRLEALGDPMMGESLGKMTFNAPPASAAHKELMAIAWLFAIGLIGIATVGRRKKP
jgi:hypothetical protein